ncbi:MAG: NFACT family protein [Clostridia bacterium]|nr:NFACT family protein [Clostridia bacterium]
MAFDGIVTSVIVKELNTLIGSKIDKIYEPDKNTVILGLYCQGKNYGLNICIDAHNCRINLTTHSRINPLVAPNFCMLLRKHLIGGRISNISMTGLERLVKIEIETINEFNEIEIKTLIIELMGKHSNIILTNPNGKIIDAMRHIDSTSSYREILPSRLYTFPNSDKHDFTTIKDFENFYSKLSITSLDELSKVISNTFTGFSLSFVNSAITKCEITSISKHDLEKLYNYFYEIINSKDYLDFEPVYKNNKISDYVLVKSKNNEPYQLNTFIDDFYFERETVEAFTNYRNTILRMILEVLDKYNKRLASINTKLKECDEMDKYKLYGELITANLYRLSNTHSSSIELENYYNNNELISIPLDTKYSPSVNAKRYFKKYSKLKNAFLIVSEQKIETEKEIDYIGSIVYELENSSTLEDIQDIFEEISENVIFKEKLKKKDKKNKVSKKKKQQAFSPIEYEIDGFKLYVGRNNKENDWLTLSFANKNDIWFHTKDVHGSHVILKVDRPINDDILVKCAEIAAKHSKAKNSSNVPVDYCLVQFVKKPHASKPGMVIFTNNKTLNVNP